MDLERETRGRVQKFLNQPEEEDSTQPASAGPPGLDDWTGLRLGRYRLVRTVGRGGMGTVWEATDLELKRRVALKFLRAGSSPSSVARMKREAQIAAALSHPNIVPIHDVGALALPTGESLPYIAMGFVEGETLAAILASGSAARADLLRRLEDVAAAIAYAHDHGVIHRDLKPANVLVEKGGRVLLTDFGLARAEIDATRLTLEGAAVGTPTYMAPEQVRGAAAEIGPRTDVYALGVILYEILAGRVPFADPSLHALYRRILDDDPEPPSPGEPALQAICLKAMSREPRHRYARAADFAADLARFRRGEPVEARPPGWSERTGRFIRRRRVSVAVLAGLAIGGAVAVAYFARRDSAEAFAEMERSAESCLAEARTARRLRLLNPDSMKDAVDRLDELCARMRAARPSSAAPHYFRGRMLRLLWDYEAALAEQDRALERDPDSAPARREQAILHLRRHLDVAGRIRLAEARGKSVGVDAGPLSDLARDLRATLEERASEAGEPEMLVLVAEIRAGRGEFDRALASLDEAAKADPGLIPEVMRHRARIIATRAAEALRRGVDPAADLEHALRFLGPGFGDGSLETLRAVAEECELAARRWPESARLQKALTEARAQLAMRTK